LLPLSDDNPRRVFPYATVTIIAACVLVFLWQATMDERASIRVLYAFGLIPARLMGEADLPTALASIPAWATIFTSMFLHGGLLHLGSNMLFLWIFGDNVEESMGHVRFIVFYFVCGAAAALSQVAADTGLTEPMVGASGAIGGILGAYILLHPQATVRTLVFLGFFVTIVHIPAMIVLGLWFLLQFLSVFAGGESNVAFWAHIGGFVAGMILAPLFKRSGVGLFQPPQSRAFSRETVRGPWD
jgi:membrane associated rhomboid family serine protease